MVDIHLNSHGQLAAATLESQLMAEPSYLKGNWLKILLQPGKRNTLWSNMQSFQQLGMVVCVDSKLMYDHVHGEGI